MLDVHPPEHAVHSWRDFFTHIATIVVGLLLAIGLEQTVEYFHHRHEVRELREALAQEREDNRQALPVNAALFRLQMAELKNNLRVLVYLRDHPGTPEEKLPGVLQWSTTRVSPAESAWKSAQETQVLSMMPREETERYQTFYTLQDDTDKQVQVMFQSMERASSFAIVDPNPSHMSAEQLSSEIGLTQQALEATVTWGIYLENLGDQERNLPSPLTEQELREDLGEVRSAEDRQKLTAAAASTKQALDPWMAKMHAAIKAMGEK